MFLFLSSSTHRVSQQVLYYFFIKILHSGTSARVAGHREFVSRSRLPGNSFKLANLFMNSIIQFAEVHHPRLIPVQIYFVFEIAFFAKHYFNFHSTNKRLNNFSKNVHFKRDFDCLGSFQLLLKESLVLVTETLLMMVSFKSFCTKRVEKWFLTQYYQFYVNSLFAKVVPHIIFAYKSFIRAPFMFH